MQRAGRYLPMFTRVPEFFSSNRRQALGRAKCSVFTGYTLDDHEWWRLL